MGELSLRDGPPRVRVLGRDGVGKTVLGTALSGRGIEIADGPSDAALYCFAGGLRATDRAAITELSADGAATPLLVVWTRADAAGSWRAADAYADRLAEVVGVPVIPVMAVLDALDPADLPAVRRIAESPAAAADTRGCDAALLARFGGYGLACATGALRETPAMPDDELLARLRQLSGVDTLLAPLAAALEGYEARREGQFDAALRDAVRVDCARRDEAERMLLDRLGRAS